MKPVSPSIEFLDDLCSVDRYNNGWNLIRTIHFGYWIFQDEAEKVLFQIPYESIEGWEKEKKLQLISHGNETVTQVRNICGTKFTMVYPDQVNIGFWVNVIFPKENPLDRRTIRVEAYTDGARALEDAVEERKDKTIKIFTKQLETNIAVTTDYISNEALKVTDGHGLLEVEIVREYIAENVYLRKTLREMLKLIPKDKIKEFNEKLSVKIPEAVEKDGLEEDFEEMLLYIGKLIDKAHDIFEKSRPPIESLSSNSSHTAMDKDLWYGKRDTILSQLMEYSVKQQPTTLSSLREASKKVKK